jgi:hypothetical protein
MAKKTNRDHEEKHTEKPKDFMKVGPTSIEGVEASDFPDSRGSVETDVGKEAKRTLPQESGTIEGEGGLRASLDASDAKRHGHWKKN